MGPLSLQTLVANELREGVVLRADGGMRSGRDVLIAAALGGDEFGFGTVAMIATGCIMARVCHTNNCPVGVASQREELRARFPGAPGDLVSPTDCSLIVSPLQAHCCMQDSRQLEACLRLCSCLCLPGSCAFPLCLARAWVAWLYWLRLRSCSALAA